MPHVITDACTKDEFCVEACPSDAVHPRKDEANFDEPTQLYVNPADCIDCGACVPVCPTGAIMQQDELPAESAHFADANAAHFA
jgi:NAD-dependent dihydropyrimidine dehydrogenase PreA subunit